MFGLLCGGRWLWALGNNGSKCTQGSLWIWKSEKTFRQSCQTQQRSRGTGKRKIFWVLRENADSDRKKHGPQAAEQKYSESKNI